MGSFFVLLVCESGAPSTEAITCCSKNWQLPQDCWILVYLVGPLPSAHAKGEDIVRIIWCKCGQMDVEAFGALGGHRDSNESSFQTKEMSV